MLKHFFLQNEMHSNQKCATNHFGIGMFKTTNFILITTQTTYLQFGGVCIRVIMIYFYCIFVFIFVVTWFEKKMIFYLLIKIPLPAIHFCFFFFIIYIYMFINCLKCNAIIEQFYLFPNNDNNFMQFTFYSSFIFNSLYELSAPYNA